MPKKPYVLALLGGSAVGKSRIAMEIAQQHHGEIINCDSVQVYRGFDIGSAKPSIDERRLVPHHVIDIAHPHDAFDAKQYCQHAKAAIADILQRHRLPIVCGGTGLYLRALRYGLIPTKPASLAMRDAWLQEEAKQPGILYTRLCAIDKASAERVHPHNVVHIMRALEISVLHDEPASAIRARHGFKDVQIPMLVVALDMPAALHRARVQTRIAHMLQAGLLDEVAGLLHQGVSPTCRPMQSVGYKEACAVVQNQQSVDDLPLKIFQSTWHYVRRQRTWLRREPDVLHCDVQDDAAEKIAERFHHLQVNYDK